jgi:hypothetical protein
LCQCSKREFFSLANFQKRATNSNGIFIISSFALNDENLWVVFSLDKTTVATNSGI